MNVYKTSELSNQIKAIPESEHRKQLQAFAASSPVGDRWFRCLLCDREPVNLTAIRCKKHQRDYEIVWFKNQEDFMNCFKNQE